MGKKFTSFLVLAAALLLTVPTHAQLVKKAAKQKVTALKAGPVKAIDVQKAKAAKAKAEDKTVGFAFTGAMHQEIAAEATLLKAAINNIESDKAAFEKLMAENRTGSNKKINSISYGTPRPVSFTSTPSNNLRRAEAVDEHGIITAPAEGELKYYARSGAAYYNNSGWKVTSQGGHAEVIECADGTVYFKNPISRLSYGSYIKGTKNGNTITIPAGQPILYNATYQATIDVKIGSFVSGSGFVPNAEQSDIIFTVDGNILTLQGTSSTDYVVLGGFWSDDDSMQSADSETVLTLDADYTPASTDPVVAPEGLVTETWNTKIDGVVSTATIGFDNNDVYVKGLFTAFPDAWIKGTVDGTTVTFSKLQYVGAYQGTVSIWATGVDENSKLADFVMTYDAVAKVLTGSNLLLNAADDKVYYLSWFENVTIQEASFEEPTAETGANVDALPYSNTLDTEEAFADFGVLDANSDDNTWQFSSSYGTYYNYSSSADADDWLISPAVKLEAGKKYHFAIDAKAAGSGFPERFEVLIGTEAKASALTQSVLPATEVAVTEYTTYENDAVIVSETGYYHFGIHAISDADQFRLMVANFFVEAGAEATAPAAVTDLAVAQTPDKLEAVVSFKAPTKTVAGEDLTDLTKIEVLRDGKVIKSLGGAEPISWDASAQGYENAQDVAAIDFGGGFTATLDGGGNTNTPKYYTSGTALRMYGNNTMTITGSGIKKIVITMTGNADQTCLEAEGFTVENKVGTWTGNANEVVFTVTSGKQARIQKIEIEGAAAGLTPGAEYTYVDDAEDLTVGTHVYQVIPYNTSGIGVKSEEKEIFISVSLEAPYTFDFSENLLDLFTVIDNNADGKTWLWNASNGAYYPYSSSNDADDYLITLPFNLKAGKRYNVIVNGRSTGYTETFEVKAGKAATVEGLTETVIAETELGAELDDYEGVFAPTEDGLYYFAIHATSPADQYNLIVSKLTVEIAPELTAPAAIADFTATAGAEGALEANIAFTAPTKDINGDALTSGALNVKIYRDGELVNTLENVEVGAAATWKDTNVENGKIYTYYAVANNESGDGLKSEKAKVFVGVDELGTVANIQITGSTANTISLSWDEVAGANGGYVNTANVKYGVVSMHVEQVWFWSVLVVDEVLGTVTGQTAGTFDYACDEGEQDYKYFGVVALNEGDAEPAVDDEYEGGYTWALLGAPYTLPFAESFTGGNLAYSTWAVSGSENTLGFLTSIASDDDCGLAITTAEVADLTRLESGRVNINGVANPTLLFDALGMGVTTAKVFASKDDGDWEVIATVPVTEDYSTVKVPLLNANGERFIRFAIGADIVNPAIVVDMDQYGDPVYEYHDVLLIDNIKVVDLYQYNLSANIKAPSSVVAGQSAKVVATVTNEGENAAKDYTVTIKAGEKVLTTVLGSDELEPFDYDEIEVDFETSVFDEAGDVTLSVTVDYENELYPDDNAASTIITVKEPTALAPTSLLAEDKGDAGVDLAWTVAAAGTEEVVENFTSYENGTNEALGDWTLINNNGATKGAIFQDLQLANDGLAKAWEVMKPSEYGISNTLFNGPNGSLEEAYLISAYNLEGQSYPDNDDWLISPELPGIAQEISFAIGALDVQYGPSSYEVWASSTDSEIASFTKVAEGTLTSAGWNSVTAQLPEGTKYFAIRNNTSGDGAMCVMLGDIKFTANSSATATSFNIYLDKEQFANVEGDKTTYTAPANKLSAGEHTFAVTAVYANGAESKPVTATVTVTTGIRQIAADGKAVDVYSLDGKLVRSQVTSLDGLKGFYIVNGKKIMVK